MENPNLSDLTALIVEDQPGMRRVLAHILRELGLREVLEAGSGKDGLSLCAEEKPDVVFTDAAMAPMSGLEMTLKIRSGENGIDPYLPVIMISSYSEVERIMEARDTGINEYLAKPVSVKLVFIRLMSVINNPRSYVRAEEFFGPDRRRRELDYAGRERRGQGSIQSDVKKPGDTRDEDRQ